MPRITTKGINTPPLSTKETDPALFQWLSQLQLVFPKISTYEVSIDLANIGAASYSTQTFTVTGLTTEDVITVNPPSLTSGLYLLSYRVASADTISLTFHNTTVSGINEPSGTYKVMACRI